MSDCFTFTTAAHVPFADIVQAINLVYPHHSDTVEDYVAQLNEAQIDFARSVIARAADGQVAGLAMLGVRGERGWCGDAAVVPQYQNQKLGQALMRRLSDSARQIGLHTLQLEVRVDNASARRVYENEGYQYSRRLLCYAATLEQLGWQPSSQPPGLSVIRVPIETVVRWYDTRDAAAPCWERELPTLLSQRNQRAWLATVHQREIAFLLCAPSSDGKQLNLHHIALPAAANADHLRALLLSAIQATGLQKFRIGLEPEDSRPAAMFRAWGFIVEKDLFEMVKQL